MIRSCRDRLFTPEGLAAIFVAILPFVCFFPATCGGIVLCPDDGLLQNLPLRAAAADMLRDGHLPLWNPYLFGGMPLFASAQGGLLFPLTWFFVLFPPGMAMNLAVLTTYSVAGLGAFLYARRAGASVLGGIATGIIWQCSGFMVAQIGHTNAIQVGCVLPWLLWSIDGYGMTGRRHRGALVALSVALAVFAGHPQTLVYSLLLGGVYALCLAVKPAKREARRAYLLSVAMMAFGLVLAAVQIWPTLELLRNSVRNEATYEFFSSFSLPPVFLLTYLAPFIVGGGDGNLFRAPYTNVAFYGEYIGYVGLIPLALASLAPLLRRDRVTIFWACAAVLSLALALGRFWPFDLYRLIYQIPVLNLFRVPARHLMEFDFALAVLAGRALTYLAQIDRRQRSFRYALIAGLALVALTIAAVTIWRPVEFRLGRLGPVSILRAPELFMPLVMAGLSAWALVRFARGKSFAGFWLIAIIVSDLALWGQSSGWRTGSPRAGDPLFQQLDVVRMLREREGDSLGKYRVVTLDEPFPDRHAAQSVTETQTGFELALQPDIYSMHRIENVAGYDGFGLARQSRLAGDMKIWGAFTDPARSLFQSRELDLLSVRYLLSRARQSNAPELLPATKKVGDLAFAEHDLGLPFLEGGSRIEFDTPLLETSRVALITNLAWSTALPDGTTVGTLTLRARDGRSWRFDLRAGIDSSEWAYERASLKTNLRHGRAPVAWSWQNNDSAGNYEGHSYVTSFALPEEAVIASGSIDVPSIPEVPGFGLTLLRMSLIDETAGRAVPLRREWTGQKTLGATDSREQPSRWIPLPRPGNIVVHQNTRSLPRAWLATETLAVPDETKLAIIRSGRLPDGSTWDPRRTVLVDRAISANLPAAPPAGLSAEIVRYEPNRVKIATAAPAASILVLADNQYPGWDVTVDGKRVRAIRADYNLRGVLLEPGQHTVQFVFRPRSVTGGFLISLLAAAALTVWSMSGRRRHHDKANAPALPA